MYQEALAKYTSNHLRSHLAEYVGDISGQFSGTDLLSMKLPEVDSVTLVGGIMQAPIDRLPLIGIDCVEKTEIPSGESLWIYQYDGAIAGLVTAQSAHDVDRLAKRYAGACEKFIREHLNLMDHNTGQPYSTNDFSLREFIYGGTGFSGAIELTLEDENSLWVDGFTIPVSWFTSEDPPRQHR